MSDTEFRRVGLMGRVINSESGDTLQQLYKLLRQRGLEVLVESELASQLGMSDVVTESASELGARCDLVVVVGGDGSLLGAAHNLCHHEAPVVGINRGRLGFLTDVSPTEVEPALDAVLGGNFTIETRFLLKMDLFRGTHLLGSGVALNDVVLDSGVSPRMIEFELIVDDRFVYRQRSDGLIVSTPTGSTAYSPVGRWPDHASWPRCPGTCADASAYPR